MTIAIDDAVIDDQLLGAALGDPATWRTWLAVLRGAFGLKLNRSDRRAFKAISGGRKPPKERVRELWAVCGRRSGKSRIAALLAVYVATLVPHKLAAGEVGTVLVLAASRDQAKVVFNYCLGALESSPVLASEVADTTSDEIRLHNGVVISIQSASYRTVRGRTVLACVFDECAFWRDESSATPDIETYRAVLPSLATTAGILVGISTGYRKAGLLYAKWRDHFGVDDADVLVVGGPTQSFNPTIDKKVIDRAMADDPEAFESEWGGGFRNDIAAFLDDETIDGAIDHGRPLELPPRQGVKYFAFVDASGGRHDAYTLAIGHIESDMIVADVVRGVQSPFDPAAVTLELAELVKLYSVKEVVSDNYSGEWVASAWKESGLRHQLADMNKSALYLEGLPMLMQGRVRIPDHPKLIRELRLLERRTSRAGRDIVDHGRNGSDDYANSLFGMLRLASAKPASVGAIGSYNQTGPVTWTSTKPERPTIKVVRIAEADAPRISWRSH